MTARVGYRVIERFDQGSQGSDPWNGYLAWSQLFPLEEVVGLDTCLCPTVLDGDLDEDEPHLAFPWHLRACFDDLSYALRRAKGFDEKRHQVLAVARELSAVEVAECELPGFRFLGFDLIEEPTEISALTNCGGFEGALSATDLSPFGLVPTAARAYTIRRRLAELFPDEDHACCAVWALWRREVGDTPHG